MEKDNQFPSLPEESFDERARKLLEKLKNLPDSPFISLTNVRKNRNIFLSKQLLEESNFLRIIMEVYPKKKFISNSGIEVEYKWTDYLWEDSIFFKKEQIHIERSIFDENILKQKKEFRKIEFQRINKLLTSFLEKPLSSDVRLLIETQIIFYSRLIELVDFEECDDGNAKVLKLVKTQTESSVPKHDPWSIFIREDQRIKLFKFFRSRNWIDEKDKWIEENSFNRKAYDLIALANAVKKHKYLLESPSKTELGKAFCIGFDYGMTEKYMREVKDHVVEDYFSKIPSPEELDKLSF